MSVTAYELCVLDKTGDTKITWNVDDAEERENVRKMVQTLKSQGYTFFYVSGESARDEVDIASRDGSGTLIARLKTEDLETITNAPTLTVETTSVDEAKPNRGRKAKAVAVPAMRGG